MQALRRPRAQTTAILAALALAAAAVLLLLLGSGDSAGPPLRIEVFAKQYSWYFGYPGEGDAFSAREFHVPDDRPIEFQLHSDDVVHGFWIPEWDVKTDAIAGGTEKLEVTPQKTGVYQVICSQSCGILHGAMKAKIIVEDPAQFQRWVNDLGSIPSHWQRLIRLDREAESIRRSVEGERPG
jgi:cytochrome c oxidase subunit 2